MNSHGTNSGFSLLGVIIACFFMSILLASAVEIYSVISGIFNEMFQRRKFFNQVVLTDQTLSNILRHGSKRAFDQNNKMLIVYGKGRNIVNGLYIDKTGKSGAASLNLTVFNNTTAKNIPRGRILADKLFSTSHIGLKPGDIALIGLKSHDAMFELEYVNFPSYLKDIELIRL